MNKHRERVKDKIKNSKKKKRDREMDICNVTHMNDKNRAIHKWDLVDILQERKHY